VDSKRICKM